MHVYAEYSGVEIEAHFFDQYQRASVPATVHWRLDCLTSNTALVDWTAVTPTTTTDPETGTVTDVTALIEVAGSDNAIQNRNNRREEKRLLVVAAKDTDREFSQEFSYQVRRVTGRG